MMKQSYDPGLGEKYHARSKRIINKDGSFNLRRTGLDKGARSLYHFLINMSWLRFLGMMFGLYILANTFFACIYLLVGVEHLNGSKDDGMMNTFLSAFMFSVQTFTTVGYGHISPNGIAANLVATVEAFLGFSGFALMTGLLYGRFSKPSSRIAFSKFALISPYRSGMSVQFRIANERENVLMEMEARVLLKLTDENNNRKYYDLPLETKFIYFFPLNWTIVHYIDEESPMYGLTEQDLEDKDIEILILIKGFDDTFSQAVHARYSYMFDEIVYGAKFSKVYTTDDNGETSMDVRMIHNYEHVETL